MTTEPEVKKHECYWCGRPIPPDMRYCSTRCRISEDGEQEEDSDHDD